MKPRSQIQQELNEFHQAVETYLRQNGKTEDGSNLSEVTLKKGVAIVRNACFQDNYSVEDVTSESPHLATYCQGLQLDPQEGFYVDIARSFHSRHYQALVGFIKQMEPLLLEDYAIDEDIESAIQEAAQPDCLDYDELGAPDFVVILYQDHIEVKAFESGVGEKIPKQGRKYIGSQGDIRWRYPLSAKAQLTILNRPVVNAHAIEEGNGHRPRPRRARLGGIIPELNQ